LIPYRRRLRRHRPGRNLPTAGDPPAALAAIALKANVDDLSALSAR
jgi:hypothetical protein